MNQLWVVDASALLATIKAEPGSVGSYWTLL